MDLIRVADDGCGIPRDELLAGRRQPRHQQDSSTPTICSASARSAFAARRWPRSPRSAASRSAAARRRATPAGNSKSSAASRAKSTPCGMSPRHDDRSSQPVLQHAGPAQVPAHDADRDGPRHRSVHAARAGLSARPLHAAAQRPDGLRPARRSGRAGADRGLLRRRSGPRPDCRSKAPTATCGSPASSARPSHSRSHNADAVSVPQRPLHSRSLAAARAWAKPIAACC